MYGINLTVVLLRKKLGKPKDREPLPVVTVMAVNNKTCKPSCADTCETSEVTSLYPELPEAGKTLGKEVNAAFSFVALGKKLVQMHQPNLSDINEICNSLPDPRNAGIYFEETQLLCTIDWA